ncbi:MAG: MraY family glycosyltransferase [Candidatus Omnitrophota bacterium]
MKRRSVLLDHGIPLIGGVAIVVTNLLIYYFPRVVFFCDYPINRLMVIDFWGVLVLIAGLYDDWKGSSVLQKFIWQSILALGLLLSGIHFYIPAIGENWSFILGFFWIVGLTNAFNLLDVSDGICSAVSFAVTIGVACLAFSAGVMDVFSYTLFLSASLAGFLFFNMPPAKAYLGNAGSHFLGFIFAGLTLILINDVPKVSMGLAVVMIFWLPILETMWLISLRLKKGINPFHKSPDHLALKFIGHGFHAWQVMLMMTGVAACFITAGILFYKFYTFSIFLNVIVCLWICLINFFIIRFLLIRDQAGV